MIMQNSRPLIPFSILPSDKSIITLWRSQPTSMATRIYGNLEKPSIMR